ncbi:hypothetical protein K1514_15620 [Paraclostridium bifermentans]|uniref:hypothetical protein n=1 Tax=Paraclostridium TaxID=1849822 RepID=UPI001CC73633|nr:MULTISPECIES: hypothetical protein [Paraclostridium]MBZ6007321.1 hypothetical protein [Paraclostridium bifermentans]MDU0295470.1 hypothetical protein [Paraclostridium sp. MRS3W1]
MVIQDMMDKIQYLSSDICYLAVKSILEDIESDEDCLYSSYQDWIKIKGICENISQKRKKGKRHAISSNQHYCLKLFVVENITDVDDLDELVDKIRELANNYKYENNLLY